MTFGKLAFGILAMSVAAAAHASAGDLDTTFAGGGWTTVPFDLGGARGDYAYATAVQADGKIVVVGSVAAVDGSNFDFGITRLTATGSRDTTFGTNGLVHLHASGSLYDIAQAVAIQPDGKIVVAGTADAFAAIFRLNANGTQDSAFAAAQAGHIYLEGSGQSGGSLQFHALALQPDGRIVAVGEGTNVRVTGFSDDFLVMRFLASGVPDSAFYGADGPGYAGMVWVPFDLTGANRDAGYAVALQSDGKIVVAGEAQYSGNDYDFAVARLNTNGSLDTTFSGDGKATVPFDRGGEKRDGARGVAIESNGTIVISGTTTSQPGYYSEIGIARLLANGALDTSFGLSGKLPATFAMTGGPTSNPINNTATGMAIGIDGSIWIGGIQDAYTSKPYSTSGYAHVSADGHAAYASGSVDMDKASWANGIARDAAGKIILVGPRQYNVSGDYDFGVARLLGQ